MALHAALVCSPRHYIHTYTNPVSLIHFAPAVPCAGVESFLMYSSQDGIRGVSLDPTDHSDTLIPVSGTLLAAGLDFHAGEELLSFSKFIISNSLRSEINAH